ncbi:MAG TPA: energy transducer TonB [Pyrinomonadaceae bacterium]
MKTKLPLLACLLGLLASIANAQTQNTRPQNAPTETVTWLRYTVKGEEFSVTLPVEPSMKTSDVFVMRLKKSRLERVIQAKAGEVVYKVFVYENPKPRQSLKEFIAEQTARSDLDLTFERDLKVGKFDGQQYSSHDRDFPSTEQYFATEGRLYRFVVSGATAAHAGAQPFFSSVALGKKQEGIEVLEGGMTTGATQTIFLGREVDTKARLLSKPEPSYTDKAKSNQVVGTVILKAVFSASGKVTNIRVVQGLPDGLTERAIAAARLIKFIPATREGKFVSMWMQLEYNFNLY